MHEFSLAQGLISQVLQLGRSHQAQEIITVRVEIGKLSGIVTDSFSFGFEVLAKENRMTEKAVLEITRIDPVKKCLECGTSYAHDQQPAEKCPECGSEKYILAGGDDLTLTQVEME